MTTPYPFVSGSVLTAQQLNDIQNLPISDKTTSYVLTVADAYKRTMMNSASATTITVNNSIFTVGDVIQVANKGAGTCTITAGAGVTINTSGSLALAQYGGGYLLCLSASTFTFFSLGGIGYGTATGGTSSSITVGGINYTLLTFTTDSSLVVSRAGLFDCLLFGGGSAGIQYGAGSGGGGGAGGMVQTTVYLNAGTYTVDIGAGGATSTLYSFGSISSIGAIPTAITAGGGAGFQLGSGSATNQGVGGGNGSLVTATNETITNTQGYKGGGAAGATTSAGGGGGVTAVGATAPTTTTGGAGGAGFDVSAFIGGSALFKGGGGGGGASATGGAGGSSVGGAGGASAAGAAAAANTGSGGGGGGSNNNPGGAGGSGIIYVRFKV